MFYGSNLASVLKNLNLVTQSLSLVLKVSVFLCQIFHNV